MSSERPEGEFADLIPELKDWNGGDGIGVETWIGCVGSFEHAIGYAQLFWPEFVEHDGCVFSKVAFDEENYRSWLRATDGDKVKAQATINHVHLFELFAYQEPGPTHKQLIYLGNFLRDVWKTKLERDLPGYADSGGLRRRRSGRAPDSRDHILREGLWLGACWPGRSPPTHRRPRSPSPGRLAEPRIG